MKNKNLNENFNVSIYAEGPNPTGRDLQNLTAGDFQDSCHRFIHAA